MKTTILFIMIGIMVSIFISYVSADIFDLVDNPYNQSSTKSITISSFEKIQVTYDIDEKYPIEEYNSSCFKTLIANKSAILLSTSLSLDDVVTLDKGNLPYYDKKIKTELDYTKENIICHDLVQGIYKWGFNSSTVTITNVSIGVNNQTEFNGSGVILVGTNTTGTYTAPVINATNDGTLQYLHNISRSDTTTAGNNVSVQVRSNNINNSQDLFTSGDGLYLFSNEFGLIFTSAENENAVQNYAGGLGNLLSYTQDDTGLTVFEEDGLHILNAEGGFENADCVDISGHNIDCKDGCTVITRFKLDVLHSDWRYVWHQIANVWLLQISDTNIPFLEVGGSNLFATSAINAQQWYWIGVNYKGNTTRNGSIWIDGKLNSSVIGTAFSGTNDYAIGGNNLCRNALNQTISHFMLFNRSLSDEQMAELTSESDWTQYTTWNSSNPASYTTVNGTHFQPKFLFETNGTSPVLHNYTLNWDTSPLNVSGECSPTWVNTSFSFSHNLTCNSTDIMNQTYNLTQWDNTGCNLTNTTFSTTYDNATCDYCIPSLTNTSWTALYNVSGCYANDTVSQEMNLTQYDSESCTPDNIANITFYNRSYDTCTNCSESWGNTTWGALINITICWDNDTISTQNNLTQWDSGGCNLTNTTFYNDSYMSCDNCTPSIVNSSWRAWYNITECLANNTVAQQQNLTQYDNYSCLPDAIANITFSNYTYDNCTYCTINLTNTSWTAELNISCQITDNMTVMRNLTQYDYAGCGGSNTTFFNYTNITGCNYCSYNVANTSTGWVNITCLVGDTMNQSNTTTEYDSNMSTCYGITNLATDLWNNGTNNTYYDYQNVSYCNYSIGVSVCQNFTILNKSSGDKLLNLDCNGILIVQDGGLIVVGRDNIYNTDDILQVSGDSYLDGDLDLTGNFTGNQIYGEMWYHNHTGTTIAFASSNVWYPLFFTDADSLNGFNYVGGFMSSSNLTAQFAGKYKVDYMASGSGQNNHIYFTSVLINGVEQNKCDSHKKMTAGGDIVTMSGTCLIDLSIGDNVQLATLDSGDTGNGAFYSANIDLIRIGD